MPATFFSPTAKMTGSAAFVSFNSKDESVFIKFIKQSSWDDKTKRGGFKDGKILNFKLSIDEAADLIRAVRDKDECSFYHTFNGEVTTGRFNHYSVEKDGKVKKGFGFTVKKGNDEYKCGLTYASGERLSQYLQFALNHVFSAIYAADKKENEERVAARKTESKIIPTKETPIIEEKAKAVEEKSEDGELF